MFSNNWNYFYQCGQTARQEGNTMCTNVKAKWVQNIKPVSRQQRKLIGYQQQGSPIDYQPPVSHYGQQQGNPIDYQPPVSHYGQYQGNQTDYQQQENERDHQVYTEQERKTTNDKVNRQREISRDTERKHYSLCA